MTDRSKGVLWIGGGIFALLVAINFIVEGIVLLLGIWMIDRGIRLRGLRPLRDRALNFLHSL